MFSSLMALFLLTHTVAVPQSPIVITDGRQIVASVERADLSAAIVPFIDIEKCEHLADRINRSMSRPAKDAYIDGGRIVPGKNGRRLNRSVFRQRLFLTYYGKKQPTIAAPAEVVYPRVDGELLDQIRAKEIGSYTTFFNAANQSRATNIALAARAINNTVLFPREEFSFNRTVGPRTKEKGYLAARIIVRGEYSEGVGGGICQVSTTLFNAADRAGLAIIQRYSHSRRVAYVPPGRDATVSWGGPDLRLRNPYNQPILIRAQKSNGRIDFRLYSSAHTRVVNHRVPSARP